MDPLLKAVCDECHVPMGLLLSKERWGQYTRARNIYIYAAKSLYGYSFDNISLILGRANHSTSWKGFQKVVKKRQKFEPELSHILERFGSGQAA